ncbi:MAG: zinc ribbon domain-containing protein [Asgard group archaeon]|nr:zinc ribbon domain-containing protein [Asgard group archaeon]
MLESIKDAKINGVENMSEEKFIICPNCGALLEKGVQFCGFCGSNVEEKKSSYAQPQQPTYSQPLPQQYGALAQSAPGQQNIYAVGDTYSQQQAESKLRLGWIFAWITFCGGSIIFFILTLYFVNDAKKLGSTSPRLKHAIIVAIIGVILNLAITIGLYVWIYLFDGLSFFYF